MYSIEQLKGQLLSMNKYLGTCIFNGEKKNTNPKQKPKA